MGWIWSRFRVAVDRTGHGLNDGSGQGVAKKEKLKITPKGKSGNQAFWLGDGEVGEHK